MQLEMEIKVQQFFSLLKKQINHLDFTQKTMRVL